VFVDYPLDIWIAKVEPSGGRRLMVMIAAGAILVE